MPQVLQLRPHVDQFRPQQAFYRFAGIHSPLPKLDQFSDLAQREAESLHLLDEVKSLDGALSVQSEPTCAANRLGQELAPRRIGSRLRLGNCVSRPRRSASLCSQFGDWSP